MAVNAEGAVAAAPDPLGLAGRTGTAEPIQLLTPEGERVEHPGYPLEVSAGEIRDLYRDLVLVRRIDFEAIALQRQGELGIWASLLGQEAAQVGSARALGPRDMAFPTYREHGVAWCRGLDPMKLLELFRGVSHGGWDPKAHNFHLYTIVIGSQTLHATGYAMGIQRDGAVGEDGEAVIAYFGDGATSQGDVNEAFIWASVTNAPIVFFCQNNQWAISEPLERQSRVPLYQRAYGFGFPGVRVDGNDVLACLAVTRKAMQAAREGQGPTLIEAFTIRSELADRQFFERVDAEASELGTRIRRSCLEMPDPEPSAMFENIYAEPNALIDAEREQFAAYLDSFVPAEEAR